MELNRNTPANWVIRSAQWFEPLCEKMRRELRKSSIVHADETAFQVLKEDDRKAEQLSRIWVFFSGKSAEKQVALYRYNQSRSGKVASDMLKGFGGCLQTDGYQGYNAVAAVIRVGCWAHARRN